LRFVHAVSPRVPKFAALFALRVESFLLSRVLDSFVRWFVRWRFCRSFFSRVYVYRARLVCVPVSLVCRCRLRRTTLHAHVAMLRVPDSPRLLFAAVCATAFSRFRCSRFVLSRWLSRLAVGCVPGLFLNVFLRLLRLRFSRFAVLWCVRLRSPFCAFHSFDLFPFSVITVSPLSFAAFCVAFSLRILRPLVERTVCVFTFFLHASHCVFRCAHRCTFRFTTFAFTSRIFISRCVFRCRCLRSSRLAGYALAVCTR